MKDEPKLEELLRELTRRDEDFREEMRRQNREFREEVRRDSESFKGEVRTGIQQIQTQNAAAFEASNTILKSAAHSMQMTAEAVEKRMERQDENIAKIGEEVEKHQRKIWGNGEPGIIDGVSRNRTMIRVIYAALAAVFILLLQGSTDGSELTTDYNRPRHCDIACGLLAADCRVGVRPDKLRHLRSAYWQRVSFGRGERSLAVHAAGAEVGQEHERGNRTRRTLR